MNNEEEAALEKDLAEQLKPIIHDDGKGLSVCFHLQHQESGTSLAIHMDARYPEVGLPNYETEDLESLTMDTAMDFAKIIWPDRVLTIEEMVSEHDDGDTAAE